MFKTTESTSCYLRIFSIGSMLVMLLSSLTPAQDNTLLSEAEIKTIKQRIVSVINQQRRAHGLRHVQIDEFASKIADQHCQEMLQAGYISHWNQAGYKPYIRYSFAGGTEAVMENVASQWSSIRFDIARIQQAVEQLHMGMYNEQPPNDGHRRNILQPQHTHVGIGVSVSTSGIRFAEEFIARYIEIKPVPRHAKPGEKIEVKGSMLFDKTDLAYIEVFYEPLPKKFSVDELLKLVTPYSFPDDHYVMRPILPDGYQYTDGLVGTIRYNAEEGDFSCPINFPTNRTGIYTIVAWVKYGKEKFPATNISIEVR
ncbi:MAG: CAP domain-containing protein [Acidobacteriota bacterium]